MASSKARVESQLVRAICAEAFGTFLLTFVDAGLAIINPLINYQIDFIGKVVAPALVVMTVIFTLGEISGAHINPAVTFAFALRGVFPWKRAFIYVTAQILGAILAAFLLLFLFDSVHLGMTVPRISTSVAAVLESIMTAFLIFTILATACVSNIKGPEAAFPVGFTLTFCGIVGKGATGASLNPARSLGVAFVANEWDQLWIYIVMPLLGGIIAVVLTWLVVGAPTKKEEKTAKAD